MVSHVTRNNYGGAKLVQTRWQENCTQLQLRMFHSSLSCFLEMSSQISCINVGSRVTASNLKSFMMDLAVIIAEVQRERCVHYKNNSFPWYVVLSCSRA